MKNIYRFFKFLILGFLFSGFSIAQDYSNGIFILNEGGAGSGNASLSFLNPEGDIENDVYQNVNSEGLGDTAQGLSIHEGKVFIAVNVSNKVVVTDQVTMEHIATISDGIANPRYIDFYGGKGYVTCWGDPSDPTTSYVAVLNLETNEVESTIAVAEGPEKILVHNGEIYVAHKGGYGHGNTISVIDPNTEAVTEIQVGDVPNSMIVYGDYLYVLGSGVPDWTGNPTDGTYYKVDLTNDQSELVFTFPSGVSPNYLSYDGGENFYFTIESEIYKMNPEATELPSESFIQTPITAWGGAYGMNVIDDVVYVADAGDFVSDGLVYTYNASTGEAMETYSVGVIPNGFYKSEGEMGTIDQTFSQISIYPNPTTHEFYIDGKIISNVEIFDLTGKLVKSTQNVTSGINIQDLAKGIYIVKIQSGNNTITKKIIIK